MIEYLQPSPANPGALSAVLRESGRKDHQALLSCADVVLNELMLRIGAEFYLSYIARGSALLDKGGALSASGSQSEASELAIALREQSGMDAFSEAIDRLNEALAAIVADTLQTHIRLSMCVFSKS